MLSRASGAVLPSPPRRDAIATSGNANAANPQIVACVSSPATARLRFASARIKAAGNSKNALPARSHLSQSFSASSQSTATNEPTPRKSPKMNNEGLIERSYHGALSTVAVSGATLAGDAGAQYLRVTPARAPVWTSNVGLRHAPPMASAWPQCATRHLHATRRLLPPAPSLSRSTGPEARREEDEGEHRPADIEEVRGRRVVGPAAYE